MPAGKMSSQVAHACANSLIKFLSDNPHRLAEFAEAGHSGSRITLKAKTQSDIEKIYAQAVQAGLPCYMMSDSGHILPPHFDGSPVVTAVGIGPCTKDAARPIVKKYRCL